MNSPQLTSATAKAVFVETHTTGRHSGTDVIGLHEAILSRQRVERSGESLILEKGWPDHIPRILDRNLSEEYPRLVKKYGKADVVAIYGEPHTGRLRSVMDRILAAFNKGMPIDKIIELGRPDSDYMDITDGIPVPAGMKIGASVNETPNDDDSHKPSLGKTVKELADEGGDNEPAPIDAGDDADEPVLDGKLVEYLKELGWNEPDSLSIARLVMAHGIKGIPDEPLKALRSFANQAARKKIRQNLQNYDPTAVVASP